MRVRGDLPGNDFTVEKQPKNPGYVLVRFFENAESFSEETEEGVVTGYEYDEYSLELKDYPGLETDIRNNPAPFLEMSKQLEAEKNLIPDLRQQVAMLEEEKAALSEQVAALESQLTDAQLALCDVYELALGGD